MSRLFSEIKICHLMIEFTYTVNFWDFFHQRTEPSGNDRAKILEMQKKTRHGWCHIQFQACVTPPHGYASGK